MASAGRSSGARRTSTGSRKPGAKPRRFAVCVRNRGYEASLERNKIYTVLPDEEAEQDGDLRVIDESGEDYLFSADRFVPIDVPATVRASLLRSPRDWIPSNRLQMSPRLGSIRARLGPTHFIPDSPSVSGLKEERWQRVRPLTLASRGSSRRYDACRRDWSFSVRPERISRPHPAACRDSWAPDVRRGWWSIR